MHAQGLQAGKTSLTRIKLDPDASLPHLSHHLLSIVLHSVCNRHDAALHRGQPQRESPSAVLYEDAKEALYGAEDGPMYHDGLLLVIALVCVLLQFSERKGTDCCCETATKKCFWGKSSLYHAL